MNSETNLLKRLLKSYPIKVLKDVFDIRGLNQKNVIDEILVSNNHEIIKTFIFNNFSFLRQHIYVYDINGTINNNWICDQDLLYNQNIVNQNNRTINLFFKATYQVFSTETNGLMDVFFYKPVQIRLNNNKLIISINIQERDIANLFPTRSFLIKKDMSDHDILTHIIEKMPLTANLVKTDINRGIKQLWEEDFVDAAFVQFKKASSTSTESMDENFTLKVKSPEEYQRLVNEPLQKNVLKILGSDVIISHFTTEPGIGKLSFTKFPETLDSIPDLVDLILSKN
ncbi:hypothetical protein OA88_12635 [Flavobacterium sp. JRM]|nr:hypothetical protein OA88_12635 [Flavobacterium sp. JRM]